MIHVSIYDDQIAVLIVLTIRCGTEDSYSLGAEVADHGNHAVETP
jgi:hypothetical protein